MKSQLVNIQLIIDCYFALLDILLDSTKIYFSLYIVNMKS